MTNFVSCKKDSVGGMSALGIYQIHLAEHVENYFVLFVKHVPLFIIPKMIFFSKKRTRRILNYS